MLSPRLALPFRSKLVFWIRALRREGHVVQLRLRGDDHAPLADEAEVGREAAEVDLAQQLAGRVPDVHAVADAGVDVAVRVAVDAVGDAGRDVGEGLAVGEGPVVFDVVAVAAGRGWLAMV